MTAILLISIFAQAATAQHLECAALFLNSVNSTSNLDYTGVSIHYAPALQFDGFIKEQTNKVLIETYKPQSRRPYRQLLTPYYNEATGLSMPYAKDIIHEAGLKAIYANYGTRVDAQVVKMVSLAEGKLSLDRLASFLIRNNSSGQVEGFIRIFDGSSFYDNGIRSYTNPELPLETILKSMNKQTNIVNIYRNKGYAVFEIGKYLIQGGLNPKKSKAMKSDIFEWVVDFLNTRGDNELQNSVYFVHVASRTHRIAYQRSFGFNLVSKDNSKNLADDESILEITGARLLDNLKKQIQELNK